MVFPTIQHIFWGGTWKDWKPQFPLWIKVFPCGLIRQAPTAVVVYRECEGVFSECEIKCSAPTTNTATSRGPGGWWSAPRRPWMSWKPLWKAFREINQAAANTHSETEVDTGTEDLTQHWHLVDAGGFTATGAITEMNDHCWSVVRLWGCCCCCVSSRNRVSWFRSRLQIKCQHLTFVTT